ncbi:MAG: PEP-CTERM sorting domain-containing protein [Betaproteobacteria bacterium]
MNSIARLFSIGASAALCQGAIAAGFEGSEVTVAAYCCTAPIEADRFTIPVTAIVGAGLEFPSGSIVSTGPIEVDTNIDIGVSSIDIGYNQVGIAQDGSFNGFAFGFVGPDLPRIAGVALNPLSTVLASSIGLTFDADTIWINAAGLPLRPDTRILVDVTFAAAVPEPRTYLMVGAGLVLLGAYRRVVVRRQQRVANVVH